jgi:hypothetical protein
MYLIGPDDGDAASSSTSKRSPNTATRLMQLRASHILDLDFGSFPKKNHFFLNHLLFRICPDERARKHDPRVDWHKQCSG